MSMVGDGSKGIGLLNRATLTVVDEITKSDGKKIVNAIKDLVSLLTMFELSVADGVKLDEHFVKLSDGIYANWPGLEEIISEYMRLLEKRAEKL